MTNNQDKANSSPSPKATHFDVVISGGGLSGALMALSLADLFHENSQALTIAIIESHAILQDASPSFDDRVLALSHGSAQYFTELGFWQTLKNDAAAIKNIHISDRGHYGKARLSAKDYSVDALGYVAEMSLIGKSLLTALKAKSNITWYAPDQISTLDWQVKHTNITLKSGKQLSASLLLACDGAQSKCRQLANIKVTTKPYGQSALIANVTTQVAHNNVAFERFTETGPIAMLPLIPLSKKTQEGRCSLVWTLPPEKAQALAELDDLSFKQQLESDFGSWLGEITHVGKRVVYPLNLVQAEQQIHHRMALVGNASHTIHPIAGQGFNLGVRDVKQLSALIKSALRQQQDIGSLALLDNYARQREQDQQQVIALTDSLVTLFSNNLPPLVAGRNIALKVFNYLSPLKKALVNKTMGY